MTQITILAVTRLGGGVCVAGITNAGQWIRVTRPKPDGSWRQLEYSDCENASGDWVVRKGNVIRMDVVKPIPDGSHSEDWLVGSEKPELVEKLSDRAYKDICKECTEDSMAEIEFGNAERSLVMIKPDELESFSFCIGREGRGRKKYIPRCTYRLNCHDYSDIGISDAEWRGYGRKLMKGKNIYSVPPKELFDHLNTNDCWLTVCGNEMNSNPYLLIVGVHLFPVHHFELDFERA